MLLTHKTGCLSYKKRSGLYFCSITPNVLQTTPQHTWIAHFMQRIMQHVLDACSGPKNDAFSNETITFIDSILLPCCLDYNICHLLVGILK